MAEANLSKLLKSMNPVPREGCYVFVSVSTEQLLTLVELRPLLQFVEDEGVTLIVPKAEADARALAYSSEWACITLKVHSDLEAVGFLAVLTSALAGRAMSVNAISAYYHDHLFVPYGRREEALECLSGLSSKSTAS